ncbi:MAG: uroporphyrinogen decarboxylase family protein [Dehalococcoidales bacterium]|jgi:uroporphyrinogen decarboxylase|nr:uroporphyrinogen decarboxylase family protein [Dehalococcoidales bacterium]
MSISNRERFLDICHFKRPGDLCLLSTHINSFAEQTLEKWVEQGAPKEIMNRGFYRDYFQFQHIHWLGEIKSGLNIPVFSDSSRYVGVEISPKIDLGHGIMVPARGRSPIVPAYEPRIIGEDEHTVTLINADGQTAKGLKEAFKTDWGMPMFLDWPVKDRATWNKHKKRLDPDTPGRWPSDWNTYVQKMNTRPEPISIQVGSFFGFLREWVGLERLLYMFHDDPGLIEEMMEQMLYLETEVIKRTLKDIKVQQATFWEDMCYKTGPLISPAMVRKFMLPRYKKVTDLLHSYGVDVIYLDSDGNLNELIPLWLEVGINLIWPFEVAAGNDAVALRKKYGKEIILTGNIDKRALIKGKETIRQEVMSKVPFLLESGGYFPSVDHTVPPDVTFDNYCYFINTLREVAGLEKLSF